MNETSLLYNYLIVGAILFCLGMAGFIVRRNMIVTFLCAEMMLQGVSLSFVAWGRYHNDWSGQMMVLFIISIAACEAGIALALILVLYAKTGKLDMASWQDLREEGAPAFVDQCVPEERADDRVWPTLTPAGIEPPEDVEETSHRSQI